MGGIEEKKMAKRQNQVCTEVLQPRFTGTIDEMMN